ncbi:MAG: O-antigen ligase family protein [Candidatus Eisenbacteria bacterium]
MSQTRPAGITGRRLPPVPGPSEVPQYSYGWAVYVLGVLLALGIAYVIFQLHYIYGQAPHRIIKILVGVIVLLLVAFKPKLALHVWLLAIPIGEWLPASGIPGVNGPNLLILIMLTSWIVPRIMSGERILSRTRLSAPVAAYILLLFFSLGRAWLFPPGAGYDGFQMLKSVWQTFLGFVVYYAAANMVVDGRQVRGLLVTFAIGSSLGALIAVRQFLGAGFDSRIGGAIGDINDLGAYFAVTASALFGLFLTSRAFTGFRRLVMGASVALASFGVFVPKSRGGYLGVVAGVGVLTYLLNKRAVIIFAVVLALSPVWAPTFVKDRIAETRVDSIEAELVGDATDRLDPSAGVRLMVWGIVAKESLRSPLVGFGYGSVPYLTAGKLSRPFSAHSLYFATLGETGLIGLAVLAWLIFACFASGKELLRVATTPGKRGLAIAFLGATVALLVANAFGQRFTHISIAGTYFFLAGLVDRSIAIERETHRSNEVGAKELTS